VATLFDPQAEPLRLMVKRKAEIRIRTYGICTPWNPDSKQLPKVVEVTTRVQAEIDVEFGLIINIKGAKNQQLHYCIDHPGIRDSEGQVRQPFEGDVYIRKNDWDFYLGDTIWEPIEDKIGPWRMYVELQGKVIAEKTFDVW
jgi:hypothetical protein